ncbi:hypothetical protein Nepgr_026197 [Nepenthes gracilis]|uniref:SURP motif domain-containing protein n=1 Tax=Nepenthes gracilis TaxID=150966 RepID=A0AAD3T7X5_NEPGR|nr:hypothetical protein Nepgr_026197 [Nepenthes gracilis]
MELEVVGRHALLFDDDATAAFVNSKEALVEWNSLSIDRYDVRHLLSNSADLFRKHRKKSSSSPPSDSQLESELDLERYADLPPPSDEPETNAAMDAAGYHSVPFSYGNAADITDQKNFEVDLESTGFHPPFPVPESLLQHLPPTEKVHLIIARTAMFVSKHGGQSEIVLRVKQGDNPTFGFLMPHHHLHPYFKYLVDHPELLKIVIDNKSNEDKADNSQTGGVGIGGALSLLGSAYGTGEEEDGAADDATGIKQRDSVEPSSAGDFNNLYQLEETNTSRSAYQKDDTVSKLTHFSKDKAPASSKHRISSTNKAGSASSAKKDGRSLGSFNVAADKSKAAAAASSTLKVATVLIEPPSELKRLVDRIVEIILKNGFEFEAVLIEQDKKHGRFPFLLPSNQYHPYYLKLLKKAQESKLSGKSLSSEKDGSLWQPIDKKTSAKESNCESSGHALHELPHEYDRKEKFKMVIGKSKKDAQEQPSPKGAHQRSGVSVDAAAAAAILQAATRGIKNPNLEIFTTVPMYGSNHGLSSDGRQASSFGSRQPSITVPVAEEIAKTVALAAASEADSSEAGMTREQKLKAERLKRAKMFAAMIKSGTVPRGKDPVHGLSIDPPGSGVSGSGAESLNREGKEREGSLLPADVGTSDKIEKMEIKHSDDGNQEQRSKKRRHYRARRREEEEEEEEENDKDGERRPSQKKHRTHRSSHRHRNHSKEKHKHRKRHSSSKGKESRRHHKHEISSQDGEIHGRKKHAGSSEDEHKSHWQKHESSGKEKDGRRGRSGKQRKKRSRSEEAELEEGEIRSKLSDQSPSSIDDQASREASAEVPPNSSQDWRPKSQPQETTEVSDDLRAKIRAMLLATL